MPDYSGGFPRARPGENFELTQTGSPNRVDPIAPAGAPDVWTLQRRLEDLQRQLDAQQTARQPIITTVDLSAENQPGWSGFATALDAAVPVPRGYGQAAIVLAVDAGQLDALGTGQSYFVQVRRAVTYVSDTAGAQTITSTPRNGNGANGDTIHVPNTGATYVQNLATGSVLHLLCQVSNTGAGSTQAYAHLTALVMFLR